MGVDKAFLELGGRTLLARVLELAATVAENVAIVGDPAKFAASAPLIADVYPGRGPLAGIHAALRHSETELNLMLAVDLPFLDDRLLKFVVAQAECSSALVTVPFVSGHYQPLCAVYRKAFASLAREQQIAIEMAYYEGMSQTEIAEALKEPLGTIKTRIRSGLTKLKELIGPSLGNRLP